MALWVNAPPYGSTPAAAPYSIFDDAVSGAAAGVARQFIGVWGDGFQ